MLSVSCLTVNALNFCCIYLPLRIKVRVCQEQEKLFMYDFFLGTGTDHLSYDAVSVPHCTQYITIRVCKTMGVTWPASRHVSVQVGRD